MGVEDWETKYNLTDNILDDYLDSEQKTWDDDDDDVIKSEIYRMMSNPECKRRQFYQTVECEVTSPESNDKDEKKTPDVGSREFGLLCKEAGSFEDETSPPEISFIPSVRKLQQEENQEPSKENLLYKTRMWAKMHIGDILENYAIYREKEEARMRRRSEYESEGSEVLFSIGSEQGLDALIEADTRCENDSYYNSRKYISSYREPAHGYYELSGNLSTRVSVDVSSVRRQRDHYIDTMNELQRIVDTVTEYLAGREEEISKYEEIHKFDDKSKMFDKEKHKDIKPDEVNDETAEEQGVTGVKNAMNSLFSSLVGAKSTGETTDTTTTITAATCSPLLLHSESGFSKLLSYIPKSNGSPTPIAVVPPAHQELSADKKSPLQPLLPLHSTETNHPVSEVGADTTTSPETQGSTTNQPQSVVDSVLGRLSHFRIFGDKQAGEATQSETPNKSHESAESKEVLTDKAKTLSIEQSASQPEHQSSCGGSCSGSVELLPETESSGEIPDVLPKEMTHKPEEHPTAQTTADDTGFFSPFKKSLTSFMTTTSAPVNKTAESPSGHSVFSIFKSAEAPKPEDAPATGTIGDKLKLSLFSSDNPATPQAQKQESGLLSGLLKLGVGEDATTSKLHVSHASTKSPLLSRALLLESAPKGNTDTGWFSNLFKMSPTESPKPQTVTKLPSKPTETINIPTVVVEPETVEDSSAVPKEMVQEDTTPKSDVQSFPESLMDAGNEEQCIKTVTQADTLEHQDQAQPEEEAMSKPQDLLTVLSGGNKTSDKPSEGGLLLTLFSSITNSTNESQAQQAATHQSKGLFSGLFKMTSTENAGTGNKPDGFQQQPVNFESQLCSTSPAGVQTNSQKQQATSQKGFLEGLFSKGSEEDSSLKLKYTGASHINDENNSSEGKYSFSGIFISEGNECSKTAISKDSASTDTTALPQSSWPLSGFFKLGSDAISSSPATPAQQRSQALLKPATTQGSNQPPSQTATPPGHPGGLISGFFKLSGSENASANGNVVPDQQQVQPGTSGVQQPNHKQPTTQSNAAPVPPQSGGLFGGILKLTESALAQSSTRLPSGTGIQPNQKSAEPSATGGILSGFLNKISVAESTGQQSNLPAVSKDPKSSQQPASAEQGSLLSGLFGISTSEVNSGSQVSPQNVNAEAQPNKSAGIISSLFNKIVDTASQSSQSDPNQNTAPQPPSGLISGLFSNKPPPQQQKAPSETQINHQQQQQGNRQTMQRQHQIPVQSAAAPESQQGGLLSGLFNKLTSTDAPPQHHVAEGSSNQLTGHPVQGKQSPPASQLQTKVFKTNTVTTASKKFSAEQKDPSIGLHQQSNRQAQQAPTAPPSSGAAQEKSQPGGLLPSILKMNASEELQQGESQSKSQTPNKIESKGCNVQESGILSGFFNKISLMTEDKSDCNIISDQKPQQHQERKLGQNRPQIQRAKPIEQESTHDGGNETKKDQKAPFQKGFLAGLFVTGSEDNSLSTLKETNEPKANFSAGQGITAGVFKSETSEISKMAITKESEKGFFDQIFHKQTKENFSSISISEAKSSTQSEKPLTLHPAVKSTQLYLEEVQRLLYGTASEYGYQDLLNLFAEHGIVSPELYEQQCLIEALLWQQLNDYALLESLEAQAQEYYTGFHEAASSINHETVMQEPEWWNLKTMDPRQFHIPSYPWQNIESSSFKKRLPQADADDDIVFDMSVKSNKCWESCDNVDNFSNQTSRNKCIEKDSKRIPANSTHSQSHFDCKIYGKLVQNGILKPQFDISKFIKRLTVKKGPIDLTTGAVDLSSFSATISDTDDEMIFEDPEWYQQWLSLLEQGMWWPDEAGDCGYYIYADEEYIYSLLTDQSGKHLYAYATQENRHDLEEIAENISNILQKKDKPKTTLCGFKIPLFSEDEIWAPCNSQAGAFSSPVDLSSAFEKGNRIINMNLECFSEMLQDSICGQAEHPADLSVYKTLQKIKIGKNEPESSKISVISNTIVQNSKLSDSKIVPHTHHALLKLADVPVFSKASTRSTRSHPETPTDAACHKKRPLPPPQNLLYNRPKLDSLMRNIPLDFSESIRNKVKCSSSNTLHLLPDLSNNDTKIEGILDFTKNRLKKVRQKHQWTCDASEDVGIDLTVEITEEGEEINMTFPALELAIPLPFLPGVPPRTVSAPPSTKFCPPDSGPSSSKNSKYMTDHHTTSSTSITSKLVRQGSIQCSKVSTETEISGRKSINTSPKVSPNFTGSKTDNGQDQKDVIVTTPQGTLSSQPKNPEIKKYSTINLQSQSAQCVHQSFLLNESIKRIPTTSQPCKNTAPANLVRNTLDMSLAPVVKPLDKTTETQVMPLVRSRRTSTADINDGSFGLPLIVDPSTVQVKQIKSQQKIMIGEVPPLQSNTETSGVSPILCRHQPDYNRNVHLSAHFSQSYQNASAPANSIKNTLDMCSKPAEETIVSSDEAVSLVRRRSRSTSVLIEDCGGISLVVDYLVTKEKPPLRRYQSQATIIKQHPAAPQVRPMIRNVQSVETVSQYSRQNVKENKTPSANMDLKTSLGMFLKPAGNPSSLEIMPLVKNNPLFNTRGPSFGLALSLDVSSKDLNQTNYSGMDTIEKTNSNNDVQALQRLVGVPSMVNTKEQPTKPGTLQRELNQWKKQFLFDQTLPGTASLASRSRSSGSQLTNIPSAPANSIRNTLDMSLSTAIKEPDKAAGRIIEMSPGKVMALVQTKNVNSNKDLVGMPLIAKAISAPKVSQNQLQSEKLLNNGHHTADTPLYLQTSTYHSNRLFYPLLKHSGELTAQSKPKDLSVRDTHSQCNDLFSTQDGQIIDFTKMKEGTSSNKFRSEQRLKTTNQKNHAPIIDLTVALDAKTQISGIKDLSITTNSFLPSQCTLPSLATDEMLICTTEQHNLWALGRQKPCITQNTSTNFKRTAKENNFNMAGLNILTKPLFAFSVEQKNTVESSFQNAHLTNKNLSLEESVSSDGSPVCRPDTNSLSTFQTQQKNPTEMQGSDFTRHPLNIPKCMQHDGLFTQATECNRSWAVSRSKGLIKQSTVESLRENTIQSWVPILNSPTCVPEIPHVLNTNKASVCTSVDTILSGQDVSSITSHGQEYSNVCRSFPALPTDMTPCTREQAVRQDMSQVNVISEVSLVQSGLTFNGSSVEPKKKPLFAINTVPKTLLSSRETLIETENITGLAKGLISKFDVINSIGVPLPSAAHTAEPSMTYSSVKNLPNPGCVATTTIRFSQSLPHPSPGYHSQTLTNSSVHTVKPKACQPDESLPLSLPTSSPVHKETSHISVCIPVECSPCTPVEPLQFLGHVENLPMEPPLTSLSPTTEPEPSPTSSPMECSSTVLQNITQIAPPPTVSPHSKQCCSPTPGSVLDRQISPLLQRQNPVYQQSNLPRHVSKSPTIIITDVEMESQEPSSVLLDQPKIPDKEADLLVSKTNCESSLMISYASKNKTWNSLTSVETCNNIHITHVPEQIIPTDDQCKTCLESYNLQECVQAVELVTKQDISEGEQTDADIFSQKQSTVGSILSKMLFLEEIPCFDAVSHTEIKERTLRFTRRRSRQMLIPQITLKPDDGCPNDEETVCMHGTGDDACVNGEDTKQQSILFETCEAVVSVTEEHTSQIDENQIGSSAIIIPVASTEVLESNMHVSVNRFISLTPKFPNTQKHESGSILVQDITSNKIECPSAGKEDSIFIKSGEVLISQNKEFFSFETTPPMTDIMSPELDKSPENKENSVLKDQKLSPKTSEISKPMKEDDVEVSSVFIKEYLWHSKEHLTKELINPKNEKGPSDFGDKSDMSKELGSVQARLYKLSSPEDQVLSTDVLSMESILRPTAVPGEQSGKVTLSLFGGPSSASSQTQIGSSVFGGILPVTSTTKESTGINLFSVFSGASPQQSQASSASEEVPAKKLFSMLSGSNVQQTIGFCGPSGLGPRCPPGFDAKEQFVTGPVDHRGDPSPGSTNSSGTVLRGFSTVGLPPRGQPPKESLGKGLFSMFSGSLNQQTLASVATPKPPASGASILGGILSGSSTPKDSTGSGLFSMFGGSSAQSFPTQTDPKCSNNKPAGKGLFFKFGGTASSDSESLFKVSSVFSLGGTSDKQKIRDFGLLSFMDDKRPGEPEAEDKATTKLDDISRECTSVNCEIKLVKSSQGKPKEIEQDLPKNLGIFESNENHDKISTETEMQSSHVIINPEDCKISEKKTTAIYEVLNAQIIEDSETKIKTVVHRTQEKQQYLETDTDDSVNVIENQENYIITEEKTLTFDVIHAQITEKSEKNEQNLTEGLKLDTRKEIDSHAYSAEMPEAQKYEKSLESEKEDKSDQTIEVELPQNKPLDYVNHTVAMPSTLELSQDREVVDKSPTETDEIPEKLEESRNSKETQNQDESEKRWSEADIDHTELPKDDLCDKLVPSLPSQVEDQETAEKQVINMPAQMVSEPLSAVITQSQPHALPETIGLLDKPKPRMVESSGQLKLEKQGPFKPTRPPESSAFSGFMSMFSGPSASSKPATSGFFTSSQPSLFKFQPTGGISTQEQQKTSFFNLHTNSSAGLSTETLTGDFFGLLKSKNAARPEETKSSMDASKFKNDDHEGANKINNPRCSIGKESGTVREPEAVALGQELVKVCERSDVETVEESRSSGIEITEMSVNHKESEEGVLEEESNVAITSLIPTDKVTPQEKHLSSSTAKSLFDLPAPSFGGLLSSAAETAKPFSSFFGSSTEIKLPQQPPDSGGLFASLKGFSAGLFKEEKSSLLKEEHMSAPSMFGKKLGFPLQRTAAYQTPTAVSTQVENKNDIKELDIEILSLESDVTESPDSSDTEEPDDTASDKQQSFDSSLESLIRVKQDMSKPGEENKDEADPFLTQKDKNATDHAMGQLPECPLKNKHSRRLVGKLYIAVLRLFTISCCETYPPSPPPSLPCAVV